jgi:hypothetical protein
VAALAAEPQEETPRTALVAALRSQELGSVEVVGVHHFRVGRAGEGPIARRALATILEEGLRLAQESWASLAAGRAPNPLPLRRLVVELMQLEPSERAPGLDADPLPTYEAHLLRVLNLALLIGGAAGLSTGALQDLGVAALLHDVGYASGADALDPGTPGASLLRHPVSGVHLLMRQRGFHEAKVRRLRAVLEHHRRYDDARGHPSLLARILAIAEDYDTLLQPRTGARTPDEAVARMAAAAGTVYDPRLLQLFVNLVGRYPPGTLLQLSDGRVGRVRSLVRDPEKFALPLVHIARLADRAAYVNEEVVDLADAAAPSVTGVVAPDEVAAWPPMAPPPEPPAPEPPAVEPPAAEAERVETAAPAEGASDVAQPAAPAAPGEADSTARPLYQGVLADVLRDLYVNRRTGVLHLTRAAERRSVRIWKGNVIHASSNLRQDHMGEVAVREGLLAQADLQRATEIATRDHKRLGQVLRELEIMGEEQLEHALAVHAREVIVKAFTWTDGYADFEEQEAAPGWFSELALRLSTPDLILEAVRRIDDPDVVRFHLGDVDRPLRLSADPLMISLSITLQPLDGFVLSRVDGHLTARELTRIVPGEPTEVQRSLFSLVCVGVIEYLPPDKRPAGSPPD